MQVYLHYPYCATLCPYCDFFSTTADEDPAYAKTMLAELDWWSRWVDGRVTTVYFGGGTPGRMAPRFTAQLLEKVDALWGIDASCEITLEANPDDITEDGLKAFRSAGVNRLSVGVQSLRDEELRWLGRRHDAAAAVRSVTHARSAGFDNLSLDLIFGLPGQTVAELDEMLTQFLSLQPEHVSLYGLTIEPGTHFGVELEAGRLTELDRTVWLDMYTLVARRAAAAGFRRYEISNFAQPGSSSRHNRAYWRDRTFVGVGPGAHGQRFVAARGVERRCNPKSLQGWRKKVSASAQSEEFVVDGRDERLDPPQWLREAAMLGIRDLDLGIDPAAWSAELGLADPELMATVERLVQREVLTAARPHRLGRGAVNRVDEVAAMLLNA